MTRSQTNWEEIFETQIRTRALTLRPRTADQYRSTVRHFLAYVSRRLKCNRRGYRRAI